MEQGVGMANPIVLEPLSDEELGRLQFQNHEMNSKEDRLKLCREIRRLREVNEDLRQSAARQAIQLVEILKRLI